MEIMQSRNAVKKGFILVIPGEINSVLVVAIRNLSPSFDVKPEV